MKCHNTEVLLNYIFCVFLIPTIIVTRSAHHNIDTLRAVGKMDILWSSLSLSLSNWPFWCCFCFTLSECLASGCIYYFDWPTDWLTDQLADQLTDWLFK